ncbi:MAG TPA: Lrp/AsnC family transcriptional regulator [Clostridiaceae bacterium]|nr:Lrp/AsnC family transcriptional regulator [Clostridiaceae bacterium]
MENATMIDKIDRKIIDLLLQNGRITHEEIAKRLNFSRPAIHQRVAKLTEKGIITAYTAQICWEKLGYAIDAFILATVYTKNFNEMIGDLLKLEHEDWMIQNIYRVTGKHCILLRVKAKNAASISVLHDQMLQFVGIVETYTMLVLQNRVINNNDYEDSIESSLKDAGEPEK